VDRIKSASRFIIPSTVLSTACQNTGNHALITTRLNIIQKKEVAV
jgi:hypothetical protein